MPTSCCSIAGCPRCNVFVKNKYNASSTGKNINLAGNDPRLLMTSKTPRTQIAYITIIINWQMSLFYRKITFEFDPIKIKITIYSSVI